MVIMNEVKERSEGQTGTPKKMCPRAARENAKKNEINSLKTAHSGLRFHFDRKKLATHEFSFNSVSKAEKITRCHHEEKSAGKQTKVESSSSTDTKKIAVLMDTLKIIRSEECSSNREKSPVRKEMPLSPVVERLTSKKGCTRCSRCSKTPKEQKSEINPLKMAKEQEQSLKATKRENNSTKTVKVTAKAPLSPKPVKKQCSKLAKLVVEPSEKSVKPKSILVHNEKPALKDEKNDAAKNNEAPQSPKPSKKQCSKLAKLLAEPEEKNMNAKPGLVHAEKSHSRVHESSNVAKIYEKTSSTVMKSVVVKSHSEMEKKVEFWPGSGNTEVVTLSAETSNTEGKSEIVNGSEHPAVLDMRVCLSNGSHDEHLCDSHLGLESPGGTRRDLVSKIPRKTHGAAGLKPDGSLNKDAMQEELIAL